MISKRPKAKNTIIRQLSMLTTQIYAAAQIFVSQHVRSQQQTRRLSVQLSIERHLEFTIHPFIYSKSMKMWAKIDTGGPFIYTLGLLPQDQLFVSIREFSFAECHQLHISPLEGLIYGYQLHFRAIFNLIRSLIFVESLESNQGSFCEFAKL